MPGLAPAIHVLAFAREDVDGRDKPGHDDYDNFAFTIALALAMSICPAY